MRIISGRYKGRRLKNISKKVSPTKDSLKEAIFNVISNRIKDAVVLDLFSGSGALGLEALSRGAKKVIFVDKEIQATRKNLEVLSLDFTEETKVFKDDAFNFIKKSSGKGLKFDLVFLDPPYHRNMAKKCLHKLLRYDILPSDGLIIAEHHTKEELPQTIGILKLIKNIKFGQTSVSIYQKGL